MKLLSSQDRKDLVNTIILNGPLFYMTTSAFVGVSYSEKEGAGPLYKVYMGLLFILGIYPFLQKGLKNQLSVKAALPLTVILIYIIFGFIQIHSDTPFFLYLVCFAVPAIGVALNMDQEEGLKRMMKWFDVLLPFFAVSFIFMVRNIMLVKLESDESAYSQITSYYAAFCFVIDTFLLRYSDYPKFGITRKKWYNVIRIILLPYFVIVCFFCGGRGASVLLFVAMCSHIGLMRQFLSRYFWKVIISIVIIFVVLAFSLGKLSNDYLDLLTSNFDRISALVEGGSIDTSASSGRDEIWVDAINKWVESPIWGFGLFSYMEVFYIRPHNIFIEIMLQGGLVLLLLFCYILFRCIIKYRKMVRFDRNQVFLMPFILYCATVLMFSGSYWYETFFWFILVYIYKFKFVGYKYSVQAIKVKGDI